MSDKNAPDSPKPVQRRGFFAAIGMGGAAAAIAIVAKPEPAEAVTPPGTKGGAHYRESEHVKQYYRVNRY
jgi:hypothetical protein